MSEDLPTIDVRIDDAVLGHPGGPVRLSVSGRSLPLTVLAEAATATGGRARAEFGRLVGVVDVEAWTTALRDRGEGELATRLTRASSAAVAAWHAGAPDLGLADGRRLPTGSRTVVQAVLNVTPDSFSDGGVHLTPDGDVAPAIAAGRAMVAAGADLVDVGGESTRPGSEPVSADEELARTVPVVRALAEDGVVVSIDTTKAVVARAAVEAGAAIVNDVSAGALDPELYPTVAELGVPYVLMHMQGTPRTMQQDPTYDDVVAEVFDHFVSELARLGAAGVPPERIVIDPGIGFGKTVEHNLTLLRQLRSFTSLGRPVLVGASRKTFIGKLSGGLDASERLEGSLAVAALAAAAGARILRVHDVRETRRALDVADAIVG